MLLGLGVQAVPQLDVHRPVLLVLDVVHEVRDGPAAGVVAGELRAVAARPPGLCPSPWRRVGIETTVRADPDEDLCRCVGECQCQTDRVVAIVEDEHRRAGGQVRLS
jgi:hypothetical protein